MFTLITWDNCALIAALAACVLRLLDHPKAGGIASSLALLLAVCGQSGTPRLKPGA
jgi:hypothetical protein